MVEWKGVGKGEWAGFESSASYTALFADTGFVVICTGHRGLERDDERSQWEREQVASPLSVREPHESSANRLS